MSSALANDFEGSVPGTLLSRRTKSAVAPVAGEVRRTTADSKLRHITCGHFRFGSVAKRHRDVEDYR